ncbi:hypothetical protein H257_17031 [Aphanomyces astaci]|uniref:F-box domain-containing protein n=1 Tax=Aphanomyces astaci TaxID=112090 RepID=W4FIG4_APHAT|nr:hypothetical protein H257_17031 [Aphanomyces astaci]ETV66601.1 hypothetical protein H257_17031 [Aphanomyces astaci]|eukprot:XP_009843972.1 hypothetical protein H257_17031 [Aphanomyces astaci]
MTQPLPDELWMHMLRYMDTTVAVFSCTQAFRRTNQRQERGVLASLWCLGRAAGKNQVWPHLHVTRVLLDNPSSRGHVEAIVAHYSVVHLNDHLNEVFDLDWLSQFLHPTDELVWHSLPKFKDRHVAWLWYSKWVDPFHSQITAMTCGVVAPPIPWLQLTRLTSLNLGSAQMGSLAPVLEFASSTSSHLVHLDVELAKVGNGVVSDDMLRHTNHWLTTTPVQVFKFSAWKWTHQWGLSMVVDTFFQALFGSDKLRHSHARHLTIHRIKPITHNGLDCVFQALVNSQIQKLMITACGLFGSKWNRLASHVAAAQSLQCVDLSKNQMSDEGATCLATALRSNTSIQHLDLRLNGISEIGAEKVRMMSPVPSLQIMESKDWHK